MDKLVKNYLDNTYKTVQVIKQTEKSKIVLSMNTVSNQPCIIKYLYKSSSPYNELQKIEHINLPKIYHIIQDDSDEKQIIVIEEYINGQTLSDLLLQKKNLSDKFIKNILKQLCEVLSVLHKNHFLHRDIKPSNIMLTSDNIVKLIDFDAARIFNNEEILDTEYLGTRGYAPPEQYGFSQTDIRSDIYALGVTIKFMEPKSERLIYIANKATKFDPEKRYQNTEAILKDLKRLTRKQKWGIGIVLSIILAVLALFGYSYYLNVTEQTEEIEQIKKEIQEIPKNVEEVDVDKLKENIKDISPIKPNEEKSAPVVPQNINEQAIPPDEEEKLQEKTNNTKKKQQKEAKIVPYLKKIHANYEVDGLVVPTLKESKKVKGEKQHSYGTMKITIINENDVETSVRYTLMVNGMYVPEDAYTIDSSIKNLKREGGIGTIRFDGEIPAHSKISIAIDLSKVQPFHSYENEKGHIELYGIETRDGGKYGKTLIKKDFSWETLE